MDKPSILLQLDTDPQPSVFDAVVAVDAGVQHLLRHGGVTPENVRELVHGAIFTRGGDDLRRTAIFVGGSDVRAGEALLAKIKKCFFGPLRVSVMIDSNGANTTAAAAVLAASAHLELGRTTALVLGATGPVGQRVVRLLARQGARVRVGSRDVVRAEEACAAVLEKLPDAKLEACSTTSTIGLSEALHAVELVIAAGAPGVPLLPLAARHAYTTLKVAIDLNAVPPLGIEGLEVTDRAQDRSGLICYGAIGVGGTKMKIHKAALRRLFEGHEQILDAEEIFAIGQGLK